MAAPGVPGPFRIGNQRIEAHLSLMLGPADQIVGAHAAIPAGQLIQGLGIIDLGVVNDQILDARLLIGGMVPGVEVVGGLLATGQIQPSP